MKILKDNALLIVLNLIIVLLLGIGMISKIPAVRACSKKLFLIGTLFEAYFLFFLLRSVAIVGVSFCVNKPYTFYWATQIIFAVLDTFLFTTLVIYSGVVLFSKEVVECRVNDPAAASYWFFVAFCVVVGILYCLIIVGLCCCISCCLCVLVIIIYRQNREIRMRDAINRVPLAQAAMQRIGNQQYKDTSQKSKEADTCIICLTAFKDEDQVAELNCDERHIFHTACLQPWLEQQLRCPLCKKEVSALPR